MKENADDPNKKDKIEKVSNLVSNMNGIKSYLKGIIKRRIKNEQIKGIKELVKEKLDNLTNNVISGLFNEEN